MTEVLAWIANVYVLIGMYLLSKGKRGGFLGQMTGSTLYMLYGCLTQSLAIVVLNLLLVVFAARAFKRWR